ncbi:MAG: SDR family oxidoreductase [Propionibacteriaceae bacterium]
MPSSRRPARRQRILITGASSGLGQELARRWAADGRRLALCARRTDRLDELRRELLAAHPTAQIETYTLDVNDPLAVDHVLGWAAEALGGLDRVVANAGTMKGDMIGTGRPENNHLTAQTNFVGVLNTAEAALKIFRRQGRGHLVLMSSVAGERGLKGSMTVYSATKAAVTTLAEGICGDLRGSEIQVSAIHPGYIKTDILAEADKVLFPAELDAGVDAILHAVESERFTSIVPSVPWAVMARAMRVVPLSVLHRFG